MENTSAEGPFTGLGPCPIPFTTFPPSKSEVATDMSDSHQSAAAAVPPASPSSLSLPDQSLSQAPTLHGASAAGLSSQDAMTPDSNFRQATTSEAGLDKAPPATDHLPSPQLHEDLSAAAIGLKCVSLCG